MSEKTSLQKSLIYSRNKKKNQKKQPQFYFLKIDRVPKREFDKLMLNREICIKSNSKIVGISLLWFLRDIINRNHLPFYDTDLSQTAKEFIEDITYYKEIEVKNETSGKIYSLDEIKKDFFDLIQI